MRAVCLQFFRIFECMNTSVILTLDTRETLKDGTCPIVFRLSHFRKSTAFRTGFSVPAKFWNGAKSCIYPSYRGYPDVVAVNNDMMKRLHEKRELLKMLHDKGELEGLTLKEVRTNLLNKKVSTSFTAYTKGHIANLKKMKRFGTARAYTSMLQAVTKHFEGNENILFSRITPAFLKEFSTAYIARGNSYNGLSAILRSLRAIINMSGEVDKERSPFKHYKIINKPTAKRAISQEAIGSIIDLELEADHPCFQARTIFVLSYFCWGMNLADLCFLKVENIVDGRIQYQRKKTGKQFDIKLAPEILPIIAYYMQGKEKSAYLLPVIKRTTDEEQDKDVLWYRKTYNKRLREIATLCGIEGRITSYVSRHSFATHAEELDLPLRVISNMLGHTKLATTEIYLRGLPTSKMDEFQDKLFKR